jgi:hypothetical protein
VFTFNNNRYLSPVILDELIIKNYLNTYTSILGYSVENRPILLSSFGSGKKKVLIWSQMHGNESTTTRSLIKLFSELTSKKSSLLKKLNIKVIYQLNPDGSNKYSRFNANGVDLNRDALNNSEPESKLLISLFRTFKPHFCINLHDQRSIYASGNTKLPALLSFLAPSYNESKSINEVRKKSMEMIGILYKKIKLSKSWSVGRYNDDFNINCFGDFFMSQNTPTILIEAGHHPNDFGRNVVVDQVYICLLNFLDSFANENCTKYQTDTYFSIPKNHDHLRDIEIKNIRGLSGLSNKLFIQFYECLKKDKIYFIPKIEKESSKTLYGNRIIDFSKITTKPINLKENNQKILDKLRLFLDFSLFLNE